MTEQEFQAVYGRQADRVYKICCFYLGNPVDAQDAVSETVADAFASIRNIRKEEAFRGWIFKILSAKCKRKLKEYANRTVELPKELAEQLTTPGMAGDEAEYLQIRMLYQELAPEERMIIAMHVFAGYTSREIAKQLHMNENTVRSKENRALKKMREKLK